MIDLKVALWLNGLFVRAFHCKDVVLLFTVQIQAHLSLFFKKNLEHRSLCCPTVRNKNRFQVAILTNDVLAAPQQNQANDGRVSSRGFQGVKAFKFTSYWLFGV